MRTGHPWHLHLIKIQLQFIGPHPVHVLFSEHSSLQGKQSSAPSRGQGRHSRYPEHPQDLGELLRSCWGSYRSESPWIQLKSYMGSLLKKTLSLQRIWLAPKGPSPYFTVFGSWGSEEKLELWEISPLNQRRATELCPPAWKILTGLGSSFP